MKTIAYIRRFLEMDQYVSDSRRKESLKTQRIIALISSIGFMLFSIVNAHEDKRIMLVTTLGGSIALAIAFGISYLLNDAFPIRFAFYAILIVMFPLYVLTAGNEGFAALWIVLVTYLVMYVIDFRVGFIISSFYFLLLAVTFWTPAGNVLFIDNAKEVYNEQFLRRFPLFFLINFAFATYVIGSIRIYQYKALMHQKALEDLSLRDLNTDLFNRNAYIDLCGRGIIAEGQPVAVIYLDANGLHELNNAKGHAAGDDMLRTIADAMKEVFGPKSCYRVGGDEFVAYKLGIAKEETEKKTEQVVDLVKERGYSVSAGYYWTDAERDLTDITVKANTTMLANKAAFYSLAENSRRKRNS